MVGLAQLGAISVAVAGEQLAGALGIAVPAQYFQVLREKRMVIIMGAWFLGNTISNGLTSTGAFEVFADGQLVFSKLATGRMPNMQELLGGVQRALAAAASAAQ